MKIEYNEKYKTITPDEGKLLRNGDIFSEFVYAPLNADESQWKDVDKSEYEQYQLSLQEPHEDEFEPEIPAPEEPQEPEINPDYEQVPDAEIEDYIKSLIDDSVVPDEEIENYIKTL